MYWCQTTWRCVLRCTEHSHSLSIFPHQVISACRHDKDDAFMKGFLKYRLKLEDWGIRLRRVVLKFLHVSFEPAGDGLSLIKPGVRVTFRWKHNTHTTSFKILVKARNYRPHSADLTKATIIVGVDPFILFSGRNRCQYRLFLTGILFRLYRIFALHLDLLLTEINTCIMLIGFVFIPSQIKQN